MIGYLSTAFTYPCSFSYPCITVGHNLVRQQFLLYLFKCVPPQSGSKFIIMATTHAINSMLLLIFILIFILQFSFVSFNIKSMSLQVDNYTIPVLNFYVALVVLIFFDSPCSVIQFCASAFAYYSQATAAQEIFGHTLQSLRGIKYLYK